MVTEAKSHKRERFELFVEEETDHLAKKTETQKAIEERDKMMRPMSFGATTNSNPWYLSSKRNQGSTSQHLAEDPMAQFNRTFEKTNSKESVKKESVKDIRDLRKERELREKKEKEKASNLLYSRRR